jgi:hypothetical protein
MKIHEISDRELKNFYSLKKSGHSDYMDLKFAYHLVRLMCEVEQIMVEHDLDLERAREQLKVIRRGEWSLEQIHEWFQKKEISLEGVYAASTLPHSPDEPRIKKLLMEVLEQHYGSLQGAIVQDVDVQQLVNEIANVIDRYKEK